MLKFIMSRVKFLLFLFPFFTLSIQAHSVHMVASQRSLAKISHRSDIVLVASPGRSGSSMLTSLMIKYALDYDVFKTHLLPPSSNFKGKIIFIFSNPDLAAESVLHLTLRSKDFGFSHFHNNLDSADHAWLKKIGDTEKQTVENNLLAYDAFGCQKQLAQWLHDRTRPCNSNNAQILAVKLENLWDLETLQALKDFLKLDVLNLPPQKERGYKDKALNQKETEFRKIYNLGTPDQPIYAAYDKARSLWQKAPPFQFLELRSSKPNLRDRKKPQKNHHHQSDYSRSGKLKRSRKA